MGIRFCCGLKKREPGAHKLQDFKEEKKEWEGKNRIQKTSIQYTPGASKAEMP